MPTSSLFVTRLYDEPLAIDDQLNVELTEACRQLQTSHREGILWSALKGYNGYTSFGSISDLPERDPAFAALIALIDPQVASFVQSCGIRLRRPLRVGAMWVNILKPGGFHTGHIHTGVVSGTYYVDVPPGSGDIQFEDPRLPMTINATPRRDGSFVTIAPATGRLLLWESWLRHEVLPSRAEGDRISISFNFKR